jgi:glyoxylase-like metal-dependent hydrolase (beta-lactamase superfamily II)
MKRLIVLGALIAAGGLSIVVVARQPPSQQGPKVVEVEKLKDKLFVLKGGGGNTAVFLAANGVVVVDAKNPGWGTPILDEIKKITPKPITTLINTHTHGDHTSGNVEFPVNIDVVTHENTKSNMERMPIFKENNGRNLPKRTFKDTLSIGSGNDQVQLHYFGRAHTNGDAFVVFPFLRVMHAGDAFSGKNIPIMDANNVGSGIAYADTLQKAHDGIKNVDTIITGHSTQMTWADLQEYAGFIRSFVNDVRTAKKEGKSVDDVAGAWKIPEKYAGYAAPQPARLKSNVQLIYNEMDGGGGMK